MRKSDNEILAYGVFSDITERKRAEDALIKSEAEINSIFRSAPVGVGLVLNRNILRVNDKVCEMTGYKKEELIGQNASILYPTVKEYEFVGKVKYELIEKYGSGTVESKWKRKTGEIIDIILSSTPIDVNDLSKGVTFSALDITERKHIESALKESEKKFKDLVEQINDWVWEMNKKAQYTYCSPAVKKIFGYDPNEMIGKTPFDFMPEEEVIKINKILMGIMERKISFNRLENVNIHKNGNRVILETSGVPIFDEQGNLIGYRGINRDITERKRAQQQIYNAVISAEEKERSRVAKELHDGVSPILSTTKLYTQTLNDFKNLKDRESIMRKIGENINEAIQTISEISTNLSPHILQNFGLVTAIKSFTDKIKETKKITFKIDFNFNERLIENIEFTLYRVTIELINNTIKHAQANEVFINFEKKEDISLIYKDDGKGFDYKKEIKKKKGMGLFNVINRVESLGGQITFETGQNTGIIIKIKIPLT